MKNKAKRCLVLYMLMVMVFLILILLSTDIVVGISEYQTGMSLEKISEDDIQAKDDIIYILGNVIISGDVLPVLSCDGWAFCETSKENPDKKISLVFMSETEVYKVDADVLERPDVGGNFHDREIQGDNHGFYAKFSPIKMKNGIYKLYIYCKENENNYGLEYTGKEYKKDYREFREWTWMSSKLDKDFTKAVQQDITINIDRIILQENGVLGIDGWAFADGINSENQKVYLCIIDSSGRETIYDTRQVEREDVGKAFQSDLYNKSGFRALISAGEIDKGEVRIRVMIEADNTVYYDIQDNIYSIN